MMIIEILENCNACNKYILIFSAHWDVLNNCFDFWLHFKDCNDEQCTCLGPRYENMLMFKKEHLSMYDHSAKCGISLWEWLYQEFSREEDRAVYAV